MPHQKPYQILWYIIINAAPNCETFVIYVIFCLIAMAFVLNPSSSDDHQSSTETDFSIINTDDEKHIDTTNWTPAKRKKLQHMAKFYEEYQQIFGERASIHTIMKKRISHMNPPMPDSVCKEEMQNATIEKDIIIEYITDAQGRKVKN